MKNSSASTTSPNLMKQRMLMKRLMEQIRKKKIKMFTGKEAEPEKECRGKTRPRLRRGGNAPPRRGEFTNCSNCPGEIVLTDEINRDTLRLALEGKEC